MNLRVKTLLTSLEERGLSALVVSGLANVRYLSGFSGSNAVAVISKDGPALITDTRYREQAAREAPDFELVIYRGDLAAAVADLLPERGRAGFEDSAAYNFWRTLAGAVGSLELEPVEGLVEGLRAVKDEGELAALRDAISCAAIGYERTLGAVRAGTSEREVAAELDYRVRLAGADGPAFETIVASGPNSSMPHASVSDRALSDGDLVVIDWGASHRGYRSDTTRTLAVCEVSTRQRELLDAVRGAADAALDALEPGVKASEVDTAAREFLAEVGLDEQFGHSLGHGVGLEAHEKPSLSARSEDTLEPGMVFTVEPGVYIDGEYGVRTEEMVLMTKSGCEVLTSSVGGGQAAPVP